MGISIHHYLVELFLAISIYILRNSVERECSEIV